MALKDFSDAVPTYIGSLGAYSMNLPLHVINYWLKVGSNVQMEDLSEGQEAPGLTCRIPPRGPFCHCQWDSAVTHEEFLWRSGPTERSNEDPQAAKLPVLPGGLKNHGL